MWGHFMNIIKWSWLWTRTVCGGEGKIQGGCLGAPGGQPPPRGLVVLWQEEKGGTWLPQSPGKATVLSGVLSVAKIGLGGSRPVCCGLSQLQAQVGERVWEDWL